MKLEILKSGINGEGIGFYQKKPVFVPGALVGEEVDVEIVERNKTYFNARLNKVLKQSDQRCRPKCRLQKSCGACPLMIAMYDEQCHMKEEILKQSLIKYAQVNPRLIQPILRSEDKHQYRNQCKVPFGMEGKELVTGMYQPHSNYFNPIAHCGIHEPLIESIRMAILKVLNRYEYKAYDYKVKKGFRTLVIRVMNGKAQVTLVTGEQNITPSCIDEIMQIEGIVSLWQSIHTQKKTPELFGNKMILLAGERYLDFEFKGVQMQLSPRSFFQLNTKQADVMYSKVAEYIQGNPELVVEAYSGIGGISFSIHNKAKEVIGIESIKDAVVNANLTAKKNKIENVSFVCEDAAFKLEYLSKKREIDVLVVDPPRTGLDDLMIQTILKSRIKQIIYVSCNPATLGKNLALLQQKYQVKRVQPLDMFPQTPNIESIVVLKRK